ncbi:hypothetical protein DFH06DRAFT_580644 [Mycena polygramma]|nr:hypothetical protein DFH06DRAFT_580644 [Mycena polygramma]
MPGMEASLLRLCNPETIWESPECFRTIDGYIRCPTVPKPYITKRLSDLLSEYASLTIFMDFLLRPFKAPSIQEMYRKSPVSPPSVPRRPGWDTSWTGMLYGGDPIYRLNLGVHMQRRFMGIQTEDWLSRLWKAIDDAYPANTCKSIHDYWEVAAVEERTPQWHNKQELPVGPYVAPPIAQVSERAQSSYSYLKSFNVAEGSSKQKSRPSMPDGLPEPDVPLMEAEALPVVDQLVAPLQADHTVYELPRKTVKLIHRLLRNKFDGAQELEGKVTWKDVCKVRAWLNSESKILIGEVQVFRSLNFTMDDSTPGSAVSFIPPSPEDRPITIHRPHPDPELSPLQIRQIGSRLRRVYGWSEEWFKVLKAAE